MFGSDFDMSSSSRVKFLTTWDDGVALTCSGTSSKLWLNAKGTFVDATDLYGVNALNDYFIQGAVSADYDNDGFQDFIVVNYGIGMGRGDKFEPCLMHNINGEKFELISLKDVVGPGNFSAACWGDVNNDGFSDVYLTNYIETMGGISDENGVEIKSPEIISLIESCLNLKVNYTVLPRRKGDPDRLVANVKCASELLNFKCKYDIMDIIKTAYNWHTINHGT